MKLTEARMAEGAKQPWYLGIVYFDASRLEYVLWPIGLHLLARGAWNLWLAACQLRYRTQWEEMLRVQYRAGFDAGRIVGRLEGASMHRDAVSEFFAKELARMDHR